MKEALFSSFLPVLPEALWALRHNFELDQYIGAREGRQISLEYQREESSQQGTLTRRKSHCCMSNNPLPGWAASLVDANLALQTTVESSWYAAHFDEERCCRFRITTKDPRLEGKLEINGRQWLVPREGGCEMKTSVQFSVRIPVFGGLAEGILAAEFGKAWAAFPRALQAYLDEHPESLETTRFVEKDVQTTPEVMALFLEVPPVHEKRGNLAYSRGFAGERRGRCLRCLRGLFDRRPRAHILPVDAA